MEPIRRGSAGPEVEDVQRRLGDLDLPRSDEPGRFGPATEAAVRTFQQLRGLPADGVVGPDTWRALVGASFRLGARVLYATRPPLQGDDVRELQHRLSRLGFDAGPADGVYGALTFDAVRDFQLNVGLADDGICGPTTVDLLRRLHRQHQEEDAYSVREREALRRPPRSSIAGARIMVDPGHSQEDPGVVADDGTQEHEVTWQLATLLEGRLAALGAHVVLSRGPSTSPPPSDRAAQANAEGVEAILSIHVNGNPSPVACGVAAYYFGSEQMVSHRGSRLAELCVEALRSRRSAPDCRTHASSAALLRGSRAPAVVVEPGFLTNPDERRLLTDPEHQRQIADALAEALVLWMVGASTTEASVR